MEIAMGNSNYFGKEMTNSCSTKTEMPSSESIEVLTACKINSEKYVYVFEDNKC